MYVLYFLTIAVAGAVIIKLLISNRTKNALIQRFNDRETKTQSENVSLHNATADLQETVRAYQTERNDFESRYLLLTKVKALLTTQLTSFKLRNEHLLAKIFGYRKTITVARKENRLLKEENREHLATISDRDFTIADLKQLVLGLRNTVLQRDMEAKKLYADVQFQKKNAMEWMQAYKFSHEHMLNMEHETLDEQSKPIFLRTPVARNREIQPTLRRINYLQNQLNYFGSNSEPGKLN